MSEYDSIPLGVPLQKKINHCLKGIGNLENLFHIPIKNPSTNTITNLPIMINAMHNPINLKLYTLWLSKNDVSPRNKKTIDSVKVEKN